MSKKLIFVNIILALLYFISPLILPSIAIKNSIITPMIFPSEGIALGFVLYYGIEVIPGIFFGQLFYALFNSMDIFESIWVALVNSFEAFVAYKIFNYFRLDTKLLTFRDVAGLILIILFVLQPISALFSNIGFWLLGNSFDLKNVFSWWFGNVVGQIIYAPFVLMLLHKRVELKHFFVLVAYLIYYLFALYVSYSVLILMIMTLPLLIYISYKFDTLYSLFAIVGSSILTTIAINMHFGLFVKEGVNIVDYNLYFLTLAVVVLIFNVIFNDYKMKNVFLEQKIKEEIEKNNQKQKLLFKQTRLAQFGELLSMIAHQWKQPLNNLSLLNQLLLMRYKGGKVDDNFMKMYEKEVFEIIDHMSNTIDDFKNFFSPNEKMEEFLPKDVIKKALELIKLDLERNNVEVELKCDLEKLIYNYPKQLMQVLINILSNSKDALIERKIDNKKISIFCKDLEDGVVIVIRDNAGGIDEKILKDIFKPYFSTKGKKGTGLGLYMSKMLIDNMDGEIKVKNIDAGVEFEIVIKDKK